LGLTEGSGAEVVAEVLEDPRDPVDHFLVEEEATGCWDTCCSRTAGGVVVALLRPSLVSPSSLEVGDLFGGEGLDWK